MSMPNVGLATFTSKANITDITTGASVDAGSLLQISVKAGGPGVGTIAVQVNNSKTGGLWYSGAWDGAKTVARVTATGVIIAQ